MLYCHLPVKGPGHGSGAYRVLRCSRAVAYVPLHVSSLRCRQQGGNLTPQRASGGKARTRTKGRARASNLLAHGLLLLFLRVLRPTRRMASRCARCLTVGSVGTPRLPSLESDVLRVRDSTSAGSACGTGQPLSALTQTD